MSTPQETGPEFITEYGHKFALLDWDEPEADEYQATAAEDEE